MEIFENKDVKTMSNPSSTYCKVTKNKFMLYLLFAFLVCGILIAFSGYLFNEIAGECLCTYSNYTLMFYVGIAISVTAGILVVVTLIKCSDY